MKAVLAPVLLFFGLISSCYSPAFDEENSKIPEEVVIDSQSYRKSFYGYLYVDEYELQSEIYKYEDMEFQKVKNSKYPLVFTKEGSYLPGTLYCAASEWEDAKSFYGDNSNFDFYMEKNSQVTKIDFMDFLQFEKLSAFCKANRKELSNRKKNVNKVVKKLHLPDTYIFYKKSSDKIFISTRGDKFFVVDGKLYLFYSYDGKDDTYTLVPVTPSDCESYFLSLINSR